MDRDRMKNGGFGSFIEILIAVVIVSMGVLSAFMLLRSSLKEMKLSKEFIAASAAASGRRRSAGAPRGTPGGS